MLPLNCLHKHEFAQRHDLVCQRILGGVRFRTLKNSIPDLYRSRHGGRRSPADSPPAMADTRSKSNPGFLSLLVCPESRTGPGSSMDMAAPQGESGLAEVASILVKYT